MNCQHSDCNPQCLTEVSRQAVLPLEQSSQDAAAQLKRIEHDVMEIVVECAQAYIFGTSFRHSTEIFKKAKDLCDRVGVKINRGSS